MPTRPRALFAAGLLAAFATLSACEKSKVNTVNYDKVTTGMTLSQVQNILGSGTDETPAAGYGVSGSGVLGSKAAPETTYVWKSSDGGTITVIFKDGKMVQKSKAGL